ncbi:hypothetical protein [Paraburkholderia sp.]|uniref:hypothetical protein n=1 Tax=Paraburkholderia sp. TaxID=1926495 RepID=UPI003D6DA9C7
MKDLLIVASALAGALLFYFSAPHQRWFRAPWRARPSRIAAAVCSIAAFATGADALHPATSLSLVVSTMMATLVACPLLGALIEQRRLAAREPAKNSMREPAR